MPSLGLSSIFLLGCTFPARAIGGNTCPGKLNVKGYGSVEIVPTGWYEGEGTKISVHDEQAISPTMGSRAYFADVCSAGTYKPEQYMGLNLLGKTMRYTTDMSKATCGCNVALYLVSMKQNKHKSQCGDFYCDANNVCGQSCAEIDIQEGNDRAWHSTLHTATDKSGMAGGYGGGGNGWNGPRDWDRERFGPGARCVDTQKPFEVEVSFPVDKRGILTAMQITLSQVGKNCPLRIGLGNYTGNSSAHHVHHAMEELTMALKAGMTPVVSYWSSPDMLWMDGPGQDFNGPCYADTPQKCGDSVKFSDFSIEDIGNEAAKFVWHEPTTTTTVTTTLAPTTTQPSWKQQHPWTPAPSWTWTPKPAWTTASPWSQTKHDDNVVLIVEADKVPAGFKAGAEMNLNGQNVKVVGVGTEPSAKPKESPFAEVCDGVRCPTAKKASDAYVFLKKNLRLGGPIRFAVARPALSSGLLVVAAMACAGMLLAISRRFRSGSLATTADATATTAATVAGGLARNTQSSQHLLTLAEPIAV